MTWYSELNSKLPKEIYDITQGSAGTMWAAGEDALFRFESEKWLRIPNPINGMPKGIKSLACDQKGNIWIGTLQSLLRFDGSAWTTERDSSLLDLLFDSEGHLWGQGYSGFYWLSENVWHKRPFRENPINTVHGLAADDHGNVLFQHTLCGPASMFCNAAYFGLGTLPTEVGYVNPDTLVNVAIELPAPVPQCIAVDYLGWPWIGTSKGLVHGSTNYTIDGIQSEIPKGHPKNFKKNYWGSIFTSYNDRFFDICRRKLILKN